MQLDFGSHASLSVPGMLVGWCRSLAQCRCLWIYIAAHTLHPSHRGLSSPLRITALRILLLLAIEHYILPRRKPTTTIKCEVNAGVAYWNVPEDLHKRRPPDPPLGRSTSVLLVATGRWEKPLRNVQTAMPRLALRSGPPSRITRVLKHHFVGYQVLAADVEIWLQLSRKFLATCCINNFVRGLVEIRYSLFPFIWAPRILTETYMLFAFERYHT